MLIAYAARVRGGSSVTHDLPEMLGGFLASNANGSNVGEDTWLPTSGGPCEPTTVQLVRKVATKLLTKRDFAAHDP